MRITPLARALAACAAGLTCLSAVLAACSRSEWDGPADASCFRRSSAMIGGPFSLSDPDGKVVTEKDFAGRRALVFFGYTYCPDVCPVTLFNLGKAMEHVPEAKRPVTVFISVDPARDTPEKIRQYISLDGYPKDIVGLTGTMAQLEAASEHFPPKFEILPPEKPGEGYDVAHSSILYVMGRDWKLETYFMDDEAPQAIARCLAALD